MARQLDGVDDLISTTTLPSTATDDITFGGWFYFDSLATDVDIVLYNGDTAANGYGLYHDGTNLNILLGGVAIAVGAAMSDTLVWMSLIVRRLAGTWQMYRDGATLGGTSTTAPVAPSGGAWHVGDLLNRDAVNLPKRAAELFFYSAPLDTDEIAALGKGYSPLMIRPASLIDCWRLLGRNSPEPGIKTTNAMTVSGATAGDHPRIIQPSRQIVVQASGNRRRRVLMGAAA